MAKPTGAKCNLDCTYCYYLEKERLYHPKSSWTMPADVLDAFIRDSIQAQPGPVVSFAWQGGEPTLLGVGFFQEVVRLQHEYHDGRPIENALQTNGVLLDDAWCRFFREHNFLVGISIDGPEHLHDVYRVARGGQPSWKDAMRGISLLKHHGVEFNTLTVLNRKNADHPHEVYRFLKDVGSGFLQFIPVVERAAKDGRMPLRLVLPDRAEDAEVTEWSVGPLQYGDFLCAVFDEWVREDVGTVFIQVFDVALESWLGWEQSLCVFKETCGQAMVIEHNGDLYSCDHYVYPRYKLGNILKQPLSALAFSDVQQSFGEAKQGTLPEYCRRCDYRFACNGECPKHRFAVTPTGEYGLNYLCAGYKRFFAHIDPYMRFMANEFRQERPPANVMRWAADRARDDRAVDPVERKPRGG
jgi:uncharacterized protein